MSSTANFTLPRQQSQRASGSEKSLLCDTPRESLRASQTNQCQALQTPFQDGSSMPPWVAWKIRNNRECRLHPSNRGHRCTEYAERGSMQGASFLGLCWLFRPGHGTILLAAGPGSGATLGTASACSSSSALTISANIRHIGLPPGIAPELHQI